MSAEAMAKNLPKRVQYSEFQYVMPTWTPHNNLMMP